MRYARAGFRVSQAQHCPVQRMNAFSQAHLSQLISQISCLCAFTRAAKCRMVFTLATLWQGPPFPVPQPHPHHPSTSPAAPHPKAPGGRKTAWPRPTAWLRRGGRTRPGTAPPRPPPSSHRPWRPAGHGRYAGTGPEPRHSAPALACKQYNTKHNVAQSRKQVSVQEDREMHGHSSFHQGRLHRSWSRLIALIALIALMHKHHRPCPCPCPPCSTP